MKRLGRDSVNRRAKRRLVLIGLGHTNCHVVHMWKSKSIPDTELVCVSDSPIATYSGMIPGLLAGDYNRQQPTIELAKFCQSAGAELVVDDVTLVDTSQNRLEFKNRSPMSYDLLSIGVGSRPSIPDHLANGSQILPIKPMQTFLPRVEQVLTELSNAGHKLVKVAIVGGGVAGVEIALCLQVKLQREFTAASLTIFSAADRLAGGLSHSTRQKISRILAKRQIQTKLNSNVQDVSQDRKVIFNDGQEESFDLVVWATSAEASTWLKQLDLRHDALGFVLTRPTLQTADQENIFAVGDSGTLMNNATPKAGVFAVRQGPVLWENINRAFNGQDLVPYRPQKKFLKLINTGDQKAIAEYGRWSIHAKWAWKLKKKIDSQFIQRYQS